MEIHQIDLCKVSEWQRYSLLVLYVVLEAWLGKTKLVKAGSLVELLANVVGFFFRRKPKESQDDKSI